MTESNMSCFATGQKNRGVKKIADPAPISHSYKFTGRTFFRCLPTKMITHTHTHFQVQGLEKGVSENEAPGPVGAYTTTHNDTITLMPNHTHTHTHPPPPQPRPLKYLALRVYKSGEIVGLRDGLGSVEIESQE